MTARIGKPIVIRIDEETLELARKQAAVRNKPLRAFLREIIQDVLREAAK